MGFDLERVVTASAQQLEELYQAARRQGEVADFQAALRNRYAQDPENGLYLAWYYRLEAADRPAAAPSARRHVHWALAVPISILTGLIFWALSDFDRLLIADELPVLALWWSPIATAAALFYLSLTARRRYGRAAAAVLALLAAASFATVIGPTLTPAWKVEQYLILAVIHLPLLCWIAIGLWVLGLRSPSADRFAFLIKSIEVIITAGLYLFFGMVFGGITVGMFAALSVDLPEIWLRLIVAGGFGLLPVLALATVYDPRQPASAQEFDRGLSPFIATMMRLLLPLTLAVLAIYLLVIPFNFLAPYENRDVLIVYNLMLFGILGLLLGATPLSEAELTLVWQAWLRRAIILVAILVALISLYALSATLYRTIQGGLTFNRLAIIGWNSVNIGILLGLLYGQWRSGPTGWLAAQQRLFGRATNAYIVWGFMLLFVVPLLV